MLDVVSWLSSLAASQGALLRIGVLGLLLCPSWLFGLALEFHTLTSLRVDWSSALEVSKCEGALRALWLAQANMTCRGGHALGF